MADLGEVEEEEAQLEWVWTLGLCLLQGEGAQQEGEGLEVH